MFASATRSVARRRIVASALRSDAVEKRALRPVTDPSARGRGTMRFAHRESLNPRGSRRCEPVLALPWITAPTVGANATTRRRAPPPVDQSDCRTCPASGRELSRCDLSDDSRVSFGAVSSCGKFQAWPTPRRTCERTFCRSAAGGADFCFVPACLSLPPLVGSSGLDQKRLVQVSAGAGGIGPTE
jgi:hypothetical protein